MELEGLSLVTSVVRLREFMKKIVPIVKHGSGKVMVQGCFRAWMTCCNWWNNVQC